MAQTLTLGRHILELLHRRLDCGSDHPFDHSSCNMINWGIHKRGPPSFKAKIKAVPIFLALPWSGAFAQARAKYPYITICRG